MGACFNYHTQPGNMTFGEVADWFDDFRAQCRVEHGTDPYNGTFSTLQGIQQGQHVTFNTVVEASDWIADKAQKWESAIAVKAKRTSTQKIKEPTFPGCEQYNNHPVLGTTTIRSVKIKHESLAAGKRNRVYVPAAELTDTQKDALVKAFDSFEAKHAVYREAEREFKPLITQLTSVNEECPDLRSVRGARTKLVKAHQALQKVQKKIVEMDLRFQKKLYKSKEVDEGEVWVIGGWCGS